MVDNIVAANSAQGGYGGLYVELDESRLDMEHNVVAANSAITESGGLTIYGVSDSQYFLRRNRIVDNSAGTKAGLWVDNGDPSSPLWGISENNLIAGNAGSGVYLQDTDFRSTNDTIADNVGYGIMMSGTLTATANLSNTIIWGHVWSFTSTHPLTMTMAADYSDVEGGWPGIDNLNLDPLFVGSGDYHLQSGSPAIDAGDNAAAPAVDLDGVPRPVPVGGLVDMGAYEYRVPGVDVIGDGTLFGDPGTVVAHTVTISNTGDAEDSFALSLGGHLWNSRLSAGRVILGPDSSTTVQVFVTVPPGSSAGDSDNVDVVATSERNAMIVDADTVETVANLVAAVNVAPENHAVANVNTTQVYHHTVKNLGNGSDSFGLGVSSSQGWTVQVHPAVVNLAAGANAMVEVWVSVPDGADGLVDVTTLTATSLADGSVTDSAEDETTAVNIANLSLTPNQTTLVGAGDSAVYTHTLTNNATLVDTISLAAGSDSGWSVNVSPANITLGAGASATISVTITTPGGAAAGAIDLTTVTATSGNAPSVIASASDVTIIGFPPPANAIYLPLVTRSQ